MLKKFLIGTLALLALTVAVQASAFSGATLKVGSKGADVIELQTLVGAVADGSFGPMTAAKVKAWQASNGLTADGVFGPKSIAKAAGSVSVGTYPAGCTSAMGYSSTTGLPCTSVGVYPAGCTSAAGYSPSTGAKCDGSTTGGTVSGPLTGSAGSATYDASSALSGESVGEGEADVQVAGVKVKADASSDIQLSAVKLVFVKTGTAGTHSKFQYFGKNVSVWLDGVKYGSLDGSEFTSSNSYTATISLSAGAVIRKSATGNLVVAVSGVDSLDSGDTGSTKGDWSVDFTSIRFMDAQGAIISEDPLVAAKAFSFAKFADAASLDFKAAVSTDSPKEGIVTAKSDTTFDATLLKFTLKAKGSDITLNKIPVLITTTGHNVGTLATQATLSWSGGSDAQDLNVAGTTESVLFGDSSDMGIKITDGSTMTFTVTTKMAKLVTANESDTIKAAVTTASIQAVDKTGADISSTYLTGSAAGEIQHMYTIAPSISVVSTSIVPVDNGSTASSAALAKIKLQITANGGTIYLNGSATNTSTEAFAQLIRDGGSASDTIGSITYAPSGTYTTTGSGATEYYTITDGSSMTIEVQALVSQGAGAGTLLVGMKASSLKFGTDSTSGTTRAANTMNWTALTDLLKTGQTALKS